MGRWFGAFIYLAAALAFVLISDANAENAWQASLVLGVASVLVGLISGWWPAVLFPLILTPLAAPFGYPDAYEYEPLPTYFWAMFWTAFSIALIVLAAALGAAARKAWSRLRPDATPH